MLTAAIVGLLMSGPNAKSIIDRSWQQTLVIGHRGAAAYKPENTLPSFEEAIASQAVATECDVHVSKDGEVIVMHDATLDRTTKLKGAVKETAAADMKAAGIPTLADLTKVTKDRIVLVVEIKDGEGVEQKVVDHLTAEKMLDQSIVFSFGAERVRKVEQLQPKLFTVWLVAKKMATTADYEEMLRTKDDIKADAFGVQYRNLTPELVKLAHARNIPVFVWTVPPGEEVDRLKSLRVNFIITDHPRDVKAQLGS